MEQFPVLRGKDDREAYELLKMLEGQSRTSDALMKHFDEFSSLLLDDKSFVRVRGFRLCCAQAKWDDGSRLAEIIDRLPELFRDKPTAVRQYLAALRDVVTAHPALNKSVADALARLDLSVYRDSMRPLIEKDVAALLALMQ